VWYAPTLPSLPEARENWMFERFLAAGIAVAGVDVGESRALDIDDRFRGIPACFDI
jgi:hypothetical protein